ncbi:MAG: YkgJ family cysteine cluster protein [Myxococcota bacterium]
MPRAITHRYQDPLDLVWLKAASELGIEVQRSESVYAAWDGERVLTLSSNSDFDADDSLAQLIFHELCHALVAGPSQRARPDWGLDNTTEKDLVYEHACHRLQAALAGRFGLRDFFAVTTEWRDYWNALPADPLAACDDPALPIARRAIAEADQPPWSDVLARALEDTAALASIARRAAPEGSLWATTRARHVSGFLAHTDTSLRCKDCAWAVGRGKQLSCRQARRAGRAKLRLASDSAACQHWEARLDAESCKRCGACCREGFDRVELRPRDSLRKTHPELVHEDSWGVFIPRPDGRCLGLEGDGQARAYRCKVYAERPHSCQKFEIGGAACLLARRRVGLSG